MGGLTRNRETIDENLYRLPIWDDVNAETKKGCSFEPPLLGTELFALIDLSFVSILQVCNSEVEVCLGDTSVWIEFLLTLG